MQLTAPEGWVWLARIKRTQGRKGEVFAEILTDFPEKFGQRRRLWLLREGISAPESSKTSAKQAPREVNLSHHWLHKGGIVLHFAGVDSISSAEELTGMVVAIPRSERAALDEGDVYISDLMGCSLVDVAGPAARVVGEIVDVDRSMGPVPMLVVRGSTPQRNSSSVTSNRGDNEILIPFAKEYLRRLDVETKQVEMALPDGLVELNEHAQS